MTTAEEPSIEGIAIIGMAGRFPGARNVTEFWKNLLNATESISTISDDALCQAGIDPEKERAHGTYVPRRGLLERPEFFDAAFFGIPPREAEAMDPQQRIFLEECWTALEDAGCDPARYAGAVGVFAGMSNNTYWANNVRHHPELVESIGWLTAMMGNEKDYLTTRVAYKLNLRGPAISINTACSTSLVAVCQAVQSLLSYACDTALAGGVSVTFPHERGYSYQEGGIVSPDGYCRAFDAQASGTVFSNGCGVVVLKRLADAVAEGDQIYAVIKGAALNNDGSGKVSFTAPSVNGHAEVIALAHALAGISPRTIGYVEAHGTGTLLGDPIEIAGLTQAFRVGGSDRGFCALGSVKPNIGHLDAAAGVAGLIKAVLCLRHGQIPGTLHFTTPNPALNLADTPFHIPTRTSAWPTGDSPRRAGVSSFGVGGTNAHCVLEAWEAPATEPPVGEVPLLLPLSAKSPAALAQLMENMALHLEAVPGESLLDLARTLQTGRTQFPHRVAIVASWREMAVSAWRGFEPKRTFQHVAPPHPPRVVFMFPGQGSQYLGMGAQLAAAEPVFRDTLNRCCELLQGVLGVDLRDLLYANDQPEARQQLRETRIAQPAIFAISYALAQLWRSWGVEPAALVGHSIGEYVAATVAGVFTLEDAVGLVAARARLVQEQPRGVMLAVRLSEAEASAYLQDGISLAAINSPTLCVLSGEESQIAALEKKFQANNVAAKRLETSHAFHSGMMEPVIAPLENLAGAIRRKPPAIPIRSTVTGEWLQDDATDPGYWARHARVTVRFSPALAALAAEGDYLFLECGPGQTLTQLARQHGPKTIITSVRDGTNEPSGMLSGLAQFWVQGVSIRWEALSTLASARSTSLPTYPFERKRYFVEPPVSAADPAPLSAASLATTAPAIPAVLPAEPAEAIPPLSIDTTPASATPPPTESRRDRCQREVLSLLSSLSGLSLAEADPQLSFIELGFDSLFLTQAAVALYKQFKVKITFRQLLQDLSSPAALAEHLDRVLPADAPASPSVAPTVTAVPVPAAPLPPLARAHGPFRGIDRTTSALTSAQQAQVEDLLARYIAKTAGSKRFTAQHRAHLADPRAVAGFRREWKEIIYPLVCGRSEGARLWDVDKNEYIDITLGFGQILFGHRPPWLLLAMEQQLVRGIEIGPTSPIAGQLAERLCRMLKLERVAFCNTGSEAVAAALRLARTVSGQDKVVVFSGAYHGIFDEVLFRPGPSPIAPGIPGSAVQNLIVLDYGTDEALQWIRQNAGQLAAVLVEPVQSRHPSLAPREFLHTLRQITQEAGTALIFDEIVTGFRVAPGGAQEYFGIQADLATYGKVLGGGMPIGIVGGRKEYLDALDGGAWNYGDDSFPEIGVTFFAGTFVRHPLMLAAASAVLDQLEKAGPELQKRLAHRTQALVERMNQHLRLREVPLHWETFSSFFYLAIPPDLRYASLLYAHLRLRGIHVWENRPCFLSEAHTGQDLESIATAFAESVDALVEAGLLPGHLNEPRSEQPPLLASVTAAASTTVEPAPLAPVVTAPAETPTQTPPRPAALAVEPPTAVEDETPFPLTDPQTELLLATQLGDEANTAFNDAIALQIHGPLDHAALQQALQQLVARRDALRTTFDVDQVMQMVHPLVPVEIAVEDLRALPPEEQTSTIQHRTRADAETPFDLARGPLFQTRLFQTGEEAHTFLFTAHHIVCDGWSVGLVAEELGTLYTSLTQGTAAPLAPALSMREYAQQQRPILEEENAWWLAQYATPPPSLALNTDFPRQSQRSFFAATEAIDLPAELCEELRRLAGRQRATIFSTLLSAFYTLLHRLTGQQDLVVGIASAGQSALPETTLVGHCVNFLPLRLPLAPEEPFARILGRVNDLVLDARERDTVTMGRLLQQITLPREPGRMALTGVSFNVDRAPSQITLGQATAEFCLLPKHRHGLELSFNLIEHQGGYRLYCHYQTGLFTASTVARWLAHYGALLRAIAREPETALSRLSLGQDASTSQQAWNQTARDYPSDLSLDLLFEIQVSRTPDAIALQDGDRLLTYAELDTAGNRAAQRLIDSGVQPGHHVALCARRSAALVIGMLGVLKAGAVYVPLDPTWPQDRLRFLVQDGQFTAFVAEEPDVWASLQLPCLRLDSLADDGVSGEKPDLSREGADPACILYTSGSTGQPKGAIIPHRAIARLVLNTDYVSFQSTDVVAHASNPAFDATSFEVWGALLNGASLTVLAKETLLSPSALSSALSTQGITTLFLTTSLFHQLAAQKPDLFATLQTLVVGGEALRTDACLRVLDAGGPERLVNGYGPTEVTTFATWQLVTPATVMAASATIPIGQPITNTTAYVLDEGQQELPVGIEGELYLGGDGVALGYWQRPELTAERFLELRGERLYRTGDRVRRRPDGVLEFLGRLDGQLKLRGFRIELGEIEAALSAHPEIQEAAAKVVGEDASRALVAFVVPRQEMPSIAELRTHLAQRLPDYMIPVSFVLTKRLPLNANGKLDRSALPDAVLPEASTGREPETETEVRVATLIASVLKRDHVFADADFFLLGGHSLLAMELLSRLRTELGAEISAATLFQAPTAAGLAAAMESAKTTGEPTRSIISSPTAVRPRIVPLAGAPAPIRAHQFLVSIQAGQPGHTPFFLVAGGWGGEIEFLVYRQLAQHLNPAQPLWGFKARGAGTYDPPHQSVAEMAEDYLKELRTIQPKGPYFIGGECVGGVCAYEMACQLREQGETVALLMLLDTSVPSAAELEQYERDETIKRAAEARGITPSQLVRKAGSKVKSFLRKLSGHTPAAPSSLPPQQGQPQYPVTLMRHKLRPYDGEVVLILDEDSQRQYGELGWRQAPTTSLRVLILPGDHISYIREHVVTAATTIREILAQASLSSPA